MDKRSDMFSMPVFLNIISRKKNTIISLTLAHILRVYVLFDISS